MHALLFRCSLTLWGKMKMLQIFFFIQDALCTTTFKSTICGSLCDKGMTWTGTVYVWWIYTNDTEVRIVMDIIQSTHTKVP